jgi:hypothetical protein
VAPLGKTLIGYLPLAIFAAVMLWRLRDVARAKPLRLATLWIMPAVLVVVAGFVLASMPPGPVGWLSLAAGALLGAGAGVQRARLMHLHVEGEGEGARVMMRQSPAALLLLMAIAAARAIFRSATGADAEGGHLPPAALYATDALLGFAVAMVGVSRIALWRKARALANMGSHPK